MTSPNSRFKHEATERLDEPVTVKIAEGVRGLPAEEEGGMSFLASARTSISAPKYSSLASCSCFILGIDLEVGGDLNRLSTSVFCHPSSIMRKRGGVPPSTRLASPSCRPCADTLRSRSPASQAASTTGVLCVLYDSAVSTTLSN